MASEIAGYFMLEKRISKIARKLLSFEFPSQQAMDDYLKSHPDADKTIHWVKEDEPGKQKAVEKHKQDVETSRHESFKKYEELEAEVEKSTEGIENIMPDIKSWIDQSRGLIDFSDEKKAKKIWKENIKTLKIIGDLQSKYHISEGTVATKTFNFIKNDGNNDTQIDLQLELKNSARLAHRNSIIATMRELEEMPEEIMKMIPKSLGFKVASDKHLKMVEHFGNQEKTMETKMAEMRLLSVERDKIMEKARSDMGTDDLKRNQLGTIVMIGMYTGIRTGTEGNKVPTFDENHNVTGEEPTYAATTIQKKHIVEMTDNYMKLKFKGKKGTTNIAEIDDPEVIKHIKKFIEGKKPSDEIFSDINANSVNKYLEDYGIVFTDFRKYRSTIEIYNGMKDEMKSLYAEIAQYTDENNEKIRKKVVKALKKHLDVVYEQARKKLSHKDVGESIDSYVNPLVLMNMLSSGRVADTFEEAIDKQDNFRFNMHGLLAEARKYSEQTSKV